MATGGIERGNFVFIGGPRMTIMDLGVPGRRKTCVSHNEPRTGQIGARLSFRKQSFLNMQTTLLLKFYRFFSVPKNIPFGYF